jgi:uncharacterized protein (DUF1697 family)
VRAEGIAYLGAVDRDTDSGHIPGPVIGDVGELEPLDGVPSLGMESHPATLARRVGGHGKVIAMRTHLALLRGINVGGRNKLPMAQLRTIADALGWADIATYIQSGNLVFTTSGSPEALGSALRRGIAGATGLEIDVIVLTRDEVIALDEACPWSDVAELKLVHAFVFSEPLSPDAEAAAKAAQAQAAAAGSSDEAVVKGRVLYVHTPDGFGRSLLVPLLDKAAVRRHTRPGTARNLATVRKLRAMIEE